MDEFKAKILRYRKRTEEDGTDIQYTVIRLPRTIGFIQYNEGWRFECCDIDSFTADELHEISDFLVYVINKYPNGS